MTTFDSPGAPPTGLRKSFLARLSRLAGRRRAALGSIAALAIKCGGTLLIVLTFIVAARSSTPSAFGQLAIAFNALSFLAVTATLGQDTLFVRCWSEYLGRDAGLARGAFRSGWRFVALGAALACTGVYLVGTLGGFGFTQAEILAGCAFLAGQIALAYSSTSCRHIINFVVSEVNRELTWRGVLLATVLASLAFGLTPTVFFTAGAVGSVLAIAIEVDAVRRGFPADVARAPVRTETANWVRRARSMWVSATTEAATQYAEVMLLGLIVSPAEAGSYFVAARVANAFSMLATGLHTYTVSYAANLFFASEHGKLQAILRSVMGVAFAMTTPLLIVMLTAGGWILGLFGPHYSDHVATLAVLAIAGYAITMSGPSSGILQTTGHERLYSRVILAALVVRAALLLVLAPRYGALGAALAWAAVNTPVAIGLSILSRRFAAVDPSVLCVFRRERSGRGDPRFAAG